MSNIIIMLFILLSSQPASPKDSGIVTCTICSNTSDSCRITIRRFGDNKDTLIYVHEDECPELLSIYEIKK